MRCTWWFIIFSTDCPFRQICNIQINIIFVATLENRFLWLFHQAIYFQIEKKKYIFLNENSGNKGLSKFFYGDKNSKTTKLETWNM